MSSISTYITQFVSKIQIADVILMVIFAALLIAASIFARSFRKRQYDITGLRKYFFIASGIIITICLLSLIINGFHLIPGKKLNFSLEFTGGTILEAGFEKTDITSEDITSTVEEFNKAQTDLKLKEPIVQMAGTPREVKFPEKYREVTLVIKNKDGSDVRGETLNGILTPIIESFGKTIFLDMTPDTLKTLSGREISLKLGVSKLDIGKTPPPAAPGESAGSGTRKSDRDMMQQALGAYDTNLELADMVVGQEISQPNKSMSYKVAIIRITKADDTNLSSDNVLALMTYMSKMYGTIYKFKIESIGPVIGNELKQKAILAVIIALVLQLIYITLRFGNQVRFGIAADIGLFHDLIVMTGVYSLTGRPFDSPFICAILTVIGYSVMDSIVIFDRIRENLKLFKKESYEQAVNISINQTMTRSINTLLTVLLCLFALFFFGGATLKNFAFSLLVGCATGAYSSIFIASPILVIIDEWVKKKEQERVATRRAALAAAAQSKAEKIREQKKEDAPARAGKEKPSEEEEAVDEESPEKTRKKVKSKQRRRYNKLAKKK